MRGALRILGKDLFELLDSTRGIVLLLVLPVLLLVLVGQLQFESPPLRMLVAGESESDAKLAAEMLDLLGEFSLLELTTRPEPEIDPLEAMRTEGFQLLLNLETDSPEGWRLYTAEADRLRLVSLQRLASGLERVLFLMQERLDEETQQEEGGEEGPSVEAGQLAREAVALDTLPLSRLLAYYPRAADHTLELVGRTAALILCFLPFVLTAPSLIRERRAHTLEVLLVAPGMSPAALVAGKSLFALTVTIIDFLLMLLVADWVYAIHVKAGAFLLLAYLVPALLAASLLGIVVSSLARTQTQTLIVSGLYFLGMTLLSGFLYPLENASALVRYLSNLFPLTFVRPALHEWWLGAGSPEFLSVSTGTLWVLCLLFGLAAVFATDRGRRRI